MFPHCCSADLYVTPKMDDIPALVVVLAIPALVAVLVTVVKDSFLPNVVVPAAATVEVVVAARVAAMVVVVIAVVVAAAAVVQLQNDAGQLGGL